MSVRAGRAGLTQAERDAAYHNGAAVPNSAALNRARVEASAVFRAAHDQSLDLAYGPGPRHAWDLYPAADPAAPCLVFIHGGYWQMNRREDFACLAEGLLAHGWTVATPGYSLAPDASLTQIVAEIFQALDWLAANRPGGPIVVSGWSAGGHLAALALAHPAVAAGLAISGVYDLEPLRDTYLNAKLRLTDAETETLSPTRRPAIPKPLAIAYGTAELPALVEDSVALHALRAAAGAPGALIPVEGADHFTILDELRRSDGLLTQAALRLIG